MFKNATLIKPNRSLVVEIGPGNLGAVDYNRAIKQHEAYIKALKKAGLEVTVLEALEDFPDSCFVEDTAVLTKKFALLCNPGVDSRNGEKVPMLEIVVQGSVYL